MDVHTLNFKVDEVMTNKAKNATHGYKKSHIYSEHVECVPSTSTVGVAGIPVNEDPNFKI